MFAKNVWGEYTSVTYSRAYNPALNSDINVGVSKNKFCPDYTLDETGVASNAYLYPQELLPEGKSPVVRIRMTGKRRGKGGDFDQANQEAGLSETWGTGPPDGYTWHHLDGFDPATGECSMQLVKSDAHTRVEGMAHSGSVAQWKVYYIEAGNSPNGLFYNLM